MDTSLSYTSHDFVTFSSDERTWIFRIRKLAEKHPDEVRIIKQPEDNDGCIYAQIPYDWFRIAPKRKLTEEQKRVAAERLQAYNSSRYS